MIDKLPPVGIDIGATAIRIADVRCGGSRLHDVVSAPLASGASLAETTATLAALVTRCGLRRRRCIALADVPEAMLRELMLPPMNLAERRKAARLEATRLHGAGVANEIVLERTASGTFVLGSIERAALDRIERMLRAARLRPVAVDHVAYALLRAMPDADAVLDVGHERARFVIARAAVPSVTTIDVGGAAFTRALSAAFRIDVESAESRKRLHGCGSVDLPEIEKLTAAIGRALRSWRTAGLPEVERIVVTGNGGRLLELLGRLRRDTGCLVEPAEHFPFAESAFPDDVVRAAAAEWAPCVGAALWSHAREAAA